MSTLQIRSTRFHSKTQTLITTMAAIVGEYTGQGLRLTARQLYYQLVSRNVIPNTERSYKAMTSTLTDARYAGLIDWDCIEDRGREAVIWAEYDGLAHLVERSLNSYRRRRWADQPCYVELWVEKQALAGILEPLAMDFHCTLMVNKGYTSASAIYAAAQRFLQRQRQGKELHLVYLRDHDPSGEDMVRDVTDRLIEFDLREINVVKVALTMDQVRQYNPPPNPAKKTDSRFAAYQEAHGNESWEVDALPPQVLQQLVTDALARCVDNVLWEEVLAQETKDKETLKKKVKGL